jgi:hypothetical protein
MIDGILIFGRNAKKKKKKKFHRDLCFSFQPFKHISKMLIHHSKVHGLHEKGLKRFLKNRLKNFSFQANNFLLKSEMSLLSMKYFY